MTLRDCLARHWSSNPPVKTPEQIDAEKYLICIPSFGGRYIVVKAIEFNRWYLFAASFMCQFCCGSLYSWSIYNIPIDRYVTGNPADGSAVYAFYIACGLLGSTAAMLGPWLERNGPRAGLTLGSTCFLAGYIVTAISIQQKWMAGIYLGFGVLTGFGLGINYISPVSALQKWFPDMRGVAAGFAVGGFGAGSIVWGKVYLPAIEAFGLAGSFIFLGCIMVFTMYCCAICMRTPPPNFTVGGLNVHGVVEENKEDSLEAPFQEMNEKDVVNQDGLKNIKEMAMVDCLMSPDFIFMYFMLSGNIVFGLVVLSRLSPMATGVFGQTPSEGATVVAINGAFNCCGRLLVPMVSDLMVRFLKFNPAFARKCIFFFTLVTQMVILVTLPAVMRSKDYDVFRFQIWLLTLCYGGGFGTIPAFLTDMFGAYNIGALHGVILTAWSIAGVAGGLGFNFYYNDLVKVQKIPMAEAYIKNINWIIITCIIGVVALFGVRTNPKDRFTPGYQYSLFGKKLFHFGAK